MKKLYEIRNFQHQYVNTTATLEAAKDIITDLQKVYETAFYVVELTVVYEK